MKKEEGELCRVLLREKGVGFGVLVKKSDLERRTQRV